MEVTIGDGEDAVAAADGSTVAAAAAKEELLIGGAESRGVASMTGELGALEAISKR